MISGLGPMTFNAARYNLAAALLLILMPVLPGQPKVKADQESSPSTKRSNSRDILLPAENGLYAYDREDGLGNPLSESATRWVLGLTLGLLNFIASTAQQIGLQYTTAGKCAFITGFDVVFVPIVGLLIPHLTSDSPPKYTTWIFVCISTVGLYAMCTTDGYSWLGIGEVFSLIGTIFWTFHIIVTDIAATYVESGSLILIQFFGTAVLSVFSSLMLESGEWSMIRILASWRVLLLLGVAECFGYALAVMGQMHALPSRAAVIISFEAIFTVIVGFLFLDETLSFRETIGCFLLMIASGYIRWDMQSCDFLKKCTHRVFAK